MNHETDSCSVQGAGEISEFKVPNLKNKQLLNTYLRSDHVGAANTRLYTISTPTHMMSQMGDSTPCNNPLKLWLTTNSTDSKS